MAWLNLPEGNQIDTVLIRSVMLYKGKGVALRDAQQRLVAYVKIEDHLKGERARDAIFSRVNNTRTGSIDWSFLKESSSLPLIEAANSDLPQQSVA